ncbi:MAG: hypothetical protein KDK91_03475, partial [Gammaproteobacteria bacterium]|nr:hypothetical protein [Gammaproteobacteria bacterium]
LPEDADWHWDYGLTLSAGRDMHERREVLGRVGEVFVCVEGGPGTEHEARVALGSGALVIPLASSGGFARELFHGLASPRCVSSDAWEALQRDDLTASEIGRVIARLVAEVERDQHS